MSLTSQIGDLGIATQVGKGSTNWLQDANLTSLACPYIWLPTLRIPQFAARNADELPKEISGRRGGWGSYVTNVAADGTVELLGRGRSLIPLFMSLMGSGISAATGSGNNQEKWEMDTSEDYNWLSLWKNVGDGYAERYSDAMVDGVTITMNNSQPARFAFDILACDSKITKRFRLNPSGPDASDYLDNDDKVRDAIEPLMVVGQLAKVYMGQTLDDEPFEMPVRNAEFRLSNASSRDEYVIGSLYRHDITKLDLTMQMTAEVVVEDAQMYTQVMYGSKAYPTVGRSMTTELTKMTGFYIQMEGPEVLAGEKPWAADRSGGLRNLLKIAFAEVQVVTFPFELQGNNLLTAQVMIRGKLQRNNASPVHIDMVVPKRDATPGAIIAPGEFTGEGYYGTGHLNDLVLLPEV
jgi:hypothetical protein